jgi:mono/diheme cytochrome c family protein
MNYRNVCIVLLTLSALVPVAFAQRGGRGGGGAAAGTGAARPIDITAKSSFNMASVERGGKIYAEKCASCHGADARGGKLAKTDVDLMRSELVAMDHSGRELPGFLAVGRPEKNMPAFQFSKDEGVDLATWLHYQITVTVARQDYQRHNVFSGDPKAGEAYFNGPVGKCNTCHSLTGDLKGIGAKNNDDAGNIQAAILGGGGRGGRGGRGGGRGPGGAGAEFGGGGPMGGPPQAAAGNVTATVTLQNGQTFTGAPMIVGDFVVEIRLPSGETKSWIKNGEWPKVTQVNKLQAHIDLMKKYTDDDIHNLAAYLRDK